MKNVLFFLTAFLQFAIAHAQSTRLWATYYGGTGYDYDCSVATDAAGNVYLAGETRSTAGNIASGGAFQTVYGGGFSDAYLVKFDAAGNRIWATYYGGTDEDYGRSVATDVAGNVYLIGFTASIAGIPTGGAFQTALNGMYDAFLVKFDATGNRFFKTTLRD